MSEKEQRLLERWAAAARNERAPDGLAERVLSEVGLDEQPRVHRGRFRVPLPLALASTAAALAAGWLLGRVSSANLSIQAERPLPSDPKPAGTGSTNAAEREQAAGGLRPDPCLERERPEGSSLLIDDFEDGDDAALLRRGRGGVWRWARDTDAPGTAPALLPVPRPGGSPESRLALHVKGGELLDWGATLELDFRPPCYDVSQYGGVAFEARGPGRVYLALREVSVIPIAEGGVCEHDCHNPHIAKLELSEDFRTYRISWEQVRKRGRVSPPLDPSQLHSIALLIRPEDTPYDVWLDDPRFLPR